jgi:hypothetical protein
METQIISHRINTIEQLKQLPANFGAEIDIRYHEDSLVLHHDPFSHHVSPYPDSFDSWLQYWNRDTPLILNVKTEGVEKACIALMQKYSITNYFFLDLSMPYSIIFAKYAIDNSIPGFSNENLCVRFSEYEPLEYALSFAGKARWVWVDSFTHCPLDEASYHKLKKAGFKICLAGPELQKNDPMWATSIKEQCKNFVIDTVCTKRPDLWT